MSPAAAAMYRWHSLPHPERTAIATPPPRVGTVSDTIDRLWQSRIGTDPSERIPHARRFAADALRCVSAALSKDRTVLVPLSADLVSSLFALWAASGLDPEEIWIELHKRERLGSLLMALNQAQSRAPRRLLKPWKVDSTKLP